MGDARIHDKIDDLKQSLGSDILTAEMRQNAQKKRGV
jgi:hypothetical protein